MTEEKKETASAEHTVMSEKDASKFQRELTLHWGEPDYVLPGGKKVSEFRTSEAGKDERERKEADAFERRSLEVNTPRIDEVAVRVEDGGRFVITPHTMKPAETQIVTKAEGTTPETTEDVDGGEQRQADEGANTREGQSSDTGERSDDQG